MPHVPRYTPTSLPRQPLGGHKPPVPYMGSKVGEPDPAVKKPGKGLRMLSRLDPLSWKYDTDRVIKILYPQLKLSIDDHTRGLVSDDTSNT